MKFITPSRKIQLIIVVGTLVSLCFSCGESQESHDIDFWPNGNVRTRRIVEQDLVRQESFHKSGNLSSSIPYLKDSTWKGPESGFAQIEHGQAKYFWENGNLRKTTHYAFGQKDGLEESFSKNGNPSMQIQWKSDERHGLLTIFSEEGEKTSEQQYSRGKLDGLSTEWFSSGLVKRKSNYRNDKLDGDYQLFYENGKLAEEGPYRAGKRVGKWTIWDEKGEKIWVGSNQQPYPEFITSIPCLKMMPDELLLQIFSEDTLRNSPDWEVDSLSPWHFTYNYSKAKNNFITVLDGLINEFRITSQEISTSWGARPGQSRDSLVRVISGIYISDWEEINLRENPDLISIPLFQREKELLHTRACLNKTNIQFSSYAGDYIFTFSDDRLIRIVGIPYEQY